MNIFKQTFSVLNTFFFILSSSRLRSQAGFAPLLVVVAVAIMAAAVPTTVILVQQEQDNRQEATNSCFPRCIARQGQVCIDGNCLVTSGRECKTTGMSGNDACVSGVCVSGFCKDTHSKLGEKCDAKEDADCDQSTSKLTCHFGICFRLQEYQESCERPENCCSNVCTNGKCAGAASACANLTPSPTTRPTATSTPSPTRSPGGVITTPTKDPQSNTTPSPTPRGERITARGTISLRVIPNGIAYDTIDLLVYRPSPGGLHTDRVNDNNSNSYTLSIPNAVWEVDRLYTYSVRITSNNKFVGGSTERFRVSQNPFVLPLTITLSENAEDTSPTNSPTLTPTPSNTGGGGGGAQPTIAPRLTAPGVGYCANHLRANSQPVGNPNCEINNASYDGKSPNPYCEQEFGGSTPYFFACPAPNNSDPIQPPPISEGEEPTCTGKSPCGGSECVIGYLKPRCGSGDSGDFLQSRQGTYCGNDYYDVYLCKDGTQDEFRNPSGDSACNSSPWCIAQASPVLSGSPTPTPASYALECPNDGNHICASSPNCDNRPSYSPKASGHQICSEYSRNSQPFCCQKN